MSSPRSRSTTAGSRYAVVEDGQHAGEAGDERQLRDLVMRLLVTRLTHARPWHSWLHGAAFARADRRLLIAGDLGDGDDFLGDPLRQAGWDLLEHGAIAIRAKDFLVLPLGFVTRAVGATVEPERAPMPITNLVVSGRRLHARDPIVQLSPAAAVTALITRSLDYHIDCDRAVERLCRLVEHQPVAHLSFSRVQRAARLVSRLEDR